MDRAEYGRDRRLGNSDAARRALESVLDQLCGLRDPLVARIQCLGAAGERLLHQEPRLDRPGAREAQRCSGHSSQGPLWWLLRDSVAHLLEQPFLDIDDRGHEAVVAIVEVVVEGRTRHPGLADHRGDVRAGVPIASCGGDHAIEQPLALGRLAAVLQRRVYGLVGRWASWHEALDPTADTSRSLENTGNLARGAAHGTPSRKDGVATPFAT